MAAPENELSRRAFRLRALIFTVLAGWILLAPGYVQLLGGGRAIVRPWVMYSRAGTSIVVADFRVQRPGGAREVVDRYRLLGFEDRTAAPRWLRRIEGRKGLDAVVEAVCRTLGPEGDLRVTARIRGPQGWTPLEDGGRNACTAPPAGSGA